MDNGIVVQFLANIVCSVHPALNRRCINCFVFLKIITYFVDCQNGKINEEFEELDEGHGGETEPQTEHSTWVGDVLKQLKQLQH